MKRPTLILLLVIPFVLMACNHVMYTPRSKKAKLRERPSVLFCDRIVDFRNEYGRWPVSRDDIANRGKKYYEVFRDFKYSNTHFKTVDSNKMIFFYSGHPQDAANFEETNKSELNSYAGKIIFFKFEDRFIWKFK